MRTLALSVAMSEDWPSQQKEKIGGGFMYTNAASEDTNIDETSERGRGRQWNFCARNATAQMLDDHMSTAASVPSHGETCRPLDSYYEPEVQALAVERVENLLRNFP